MVMISARRAAFGCLALLFAASTAAATTSNEAEILKVEEGWSRAMAINDAGAIAAFTDETWVIVSSDGTTMRAAFLAVVASGDLVHTQMTLQPDTVRVYGDVAVVSGIATSSGKWKGVAFATRERSTDIFVKRDGRWRCVFTQLTPLPASGK